ncbi:hypothetical protein Pmar_PMAR014313 [Perkinsus marinus ATCC 50983]|uniref:Uncharacterized protein n=1 Tax=Perkinsus marinus (strain ATCC 50983 / TXsc) TaxID=423536 RepID=C5KLL4_PERM5|nr:hypothetical protein Pmar_PMAR014313 [Perkinsus marinus ATCC 50983]EER14629.1 hypothetical protein Pmar_PMAR014313 [Perkinsus marinus ATCC 50983]|eukprot:XP_002782833.1 hypothetical protein Pmar_PMAR014313 [Perkinsus marinus ATCC 50983]
MRSFPQYTQENLEENSHPPSPSQVVDAILRMAAGESVPARGGDILGYGGHNVQHRTHERGLNQDGGSLSNPVWEHYQHSQRQGHSTDWGGEKAQRKGKGRGKGKYSHGGNRRSSDGSPSGNQTGGNANRRGRKGSGRGEGNGHQRTYTPNVEAGMLNLENVPVTDEEWGEGALMLTQDSPPSTSPGVEKSNLPRPPEHTLAPQLAPKISSSAGAPSPSSSGLSRSVPSIDPSQELDVDPEVLRATIEALTVENTVARRSGGATTSRGTSGLEDSLNPNGVLEDTPNGPRLRVDKEAAMRIICHYAGLRRPPKPTAPPSFPSAP